MAVTLDATGTKQTFSTLASGGSISYTGLTIGTGLTNSAAIFFVGWADSGGGANNVTFSSPTWNSVSSPQVINQAFSGSIGNGVAWFALVNPASGSHTFSVTVTNSGGATSDFVVYGISFSGVDQTGGTTSFANSAGTSGTTTSLAQNITTASGDYTACGCSVGTGNGTSTLQLAAVATQDFLDSTFTGNNFAAGKAAFGANPAAWTAHNSSSDTAVIAGFHIVASAAVANPFKQTDWPVPTPPNREPTLLSWIQAYKLLLYQGKDQLPGRQLEWQVPRSIEPYPYRSWEAKYNPNLIGKDVLPRNQLEWQVPRSPEPYPYRSWEAFYNRNLIGKDKFFDGPGNGPDFDTPLPRSPEPYPYRTWTQNLLQTTLAPSLAKPFNQYDWQLPRGTEPDWRRSWEFWFNYNLRGLDQLPVRQLDWQLPIAPPRIDQTWIVNLQLSTLAPVVTTVPFRQFDWPLPQGYAPLSYNANQPLNLYLQPTFIMFPFKWDIFTGPPQPDRSSSLNLLLTTLATPPVQRPFVQTDWPLPTAALQASPSWTWSYNPNLIGQDQLPVRQKDWQLPQTLQYVERTAAQNLLLTTLAPPSTAMPFRQLDWRLPDFFLQ